MYSPEIAPIVMYRHIRDGCSTDAMTPREKTNPPTISVSWKPKRLARNHTHGAGMEEQNVCHGGTKSLLRGNSG